MAFRSRVVVSSSASARRWASRVYWSLIVATSGLAYYVVSAVLRRPFFSSICVVVAMLLWRYLTNAGSFWHQSQQLENQFWMLLTFMFTGNCLFSPDSPYLITGGEVVNPGLGKVLGSAVVIGCTMTAHFVDKHHHRTRLRASPVLEHFKNIKNITAEGKVELIGKLIGQLDRVLPSTFQAFWNRKNYVSIEQQILNVFSDCSRDELNYVLLKSEMKLVAYKLKNHSKTNDYPFDLSAPMYSRQNRSRSALLDILASRRNSDLTLASRVVVLDIISTLRMTMNGDTAVEAQNWVKHLLLTVKGSDLCDLKQLVDNKGSVESMHKLLYEDITERKVRGEILEHFLKQAAILNVQKSMGGPLSRKILQKGAWRKILSDVDDTLFSSGGHHPAGIDHSYKRKTFYPGITSLYRELDLGTVGPDANSGIWPPTRFGDLVFLSARPHVYKDLTENSMYRKFRKFMKTHDLHCMPTLLFGDMESGQAFMIQGNFQPMAEKKMRNFEQYHSIYPEFTHVFIGDNGQADVKAAEMMIEKYGRKVVERVFIHEVQPRQFTFGYEPFISEAKWDRYGIVFCKTYVGAAVQAASAHGKESKPMISNLGLRRIVVAARREFMRIQNTWEDLYERDTRRMELNQDIETANRFLKKSGLDPVDLIPGQCAFQKGALVYTGFGRGYVGNYRPSDGIYEIYLDWKLSAIYAPRLYTVIHNIFASEKELKNFHKELFTHNKDKKKGKDSSASISGRPRSYTADTDISTSSWQTAPERLSYAPQPGGGIVSVVPADDLAKQNSSGALSRSSSSSITSGSSLLRPDNDDNSLQRMSSTNGHSNRDLEEAVKENSSPKLTPIAPASSFTTSSYFTPVISYPGASKSGTYYRKRMPSEDSLRKNSPAAKLTRSSTAGSIDSEKGNLANSPSAPPPFRLSGDVESKSPEMETLKKQHSTQENKADLAFAPRVKEQLNDILELGAKVETPYGQGVVLHFRERDDIYKLAIKNTNLTAFVSELSLIKWNRPLFEARASEMFKEGSLPGRWFGLMKKFLTGGPSVQPHTTDESLIIKVLPNDTIVKTDFGRAIVENFRKEDKIYKLRFIWGATGYFPQTKVSEDKSGDQSTDMEIAIALKKDQSPLQRAKEMVAKNWARFKLPFSVMGGSLLPGRNQNQEIMPTSDSLLSLSSLVSATSTASSSSFFSIPEEQQRICELWKLGEGDRIDLNSLGPGVIQEIRSDGVFVVKLRFGMAYIPVPRPLFPKASWYGTLRANHFIANGSRVMTPFGFGQVESFRQEDNMYCVKLEKWGGRLYTSMSSTPPIISERFASRTLSDSAPFSPGPENADDPESGGFKSSILSFITSIIPGVSQPEDEAPGSATSESAEVAVSIPFNPSKFVGHTRYSFEPPFVVDHTMTTVPPGHTAFSWNALHHEAAL